MELSKKYLRTSARLTIRWALGMWELRGLSIGHEIVDQLIAAGKDKDDTVLGTAAYFGKWLNEYIRADLLATEEIEVADRMSRKKHWFDSFAYVMRRLEQRMAVNRERLLEGLTPEERREVEARLAAKGRAVRPKI